jgi:hypothetical protein
LNGQFIALLHKLYLRPDQKVKAVRTGMLLSSEHITALCEVDLAVSAI